jgi:hypothetical protein
MKKTLFDRIEEAVKATGAEARQTGISAGLYYDGTQHGEIIESVYISVSKYTARHYDGDASKTAAAARKAAGRFKGVTVKEISHPSYYIYIVTTTDDRERADALQAKAEIFLKAFHQERHRQRITGEPDDANKAIKAGHDALKTAGYRAAEDTAA